MRWLDGMRSRERLPHWDRVLRIREERDPISSASYGPLVAVATTSKPDVPED